MFVRIISINAQCTANWFDAYSISQKQIIWSHKYEFIDTKGPLKFKFSGFHVPSYSFTSCSAANYWLRFAQGKWKGLKPVFLIQIQYWDFCDCRKINTHVCWLTTAHHSVSPKPKRVSLTCLESENRLTWATFSTIISVFVLKSLYVLIF